MLKIELAAMPTVIDSPPRCNPRPTQAELIDMKLNDMANPTLNQNQRVYVIQRFGLDIRSART